MSLTEQDRTDLAEIGELTARAVAKLKALEARHGLDITGPAMDALTRADVSLEFVPRELRQAERYMDAA
jgi:hypothetical protein